MVRRSWALCLLLIAAVGAWAAPAQVPVTTDLARDGQTAGQRQLPILLVFAAEHCAYCELLEREILQPMVLSGDYRDKVVIRKVMLDGSDPLLDFDGHRVDAGSFASHRDVFVTPTMLFVDPQGHELAPRLVGINTVEMFGGLVDAAIEQARKKLRSRSSVAQAGPPRP